MRYTKTIPSEKELLDSYNTLYTKDLARKFGVGTTTVIKWLKKYGIYKTKVGKNCVVCSRFYFIKSKRSIYCSYQCNRQAQTNRGGYKVNKVKALEWRHRIKEAFEQYKTAIGCQICQYNKYGGSLVFHHIDPSQKVREINSVDYYYKTEHYKSERPKCILICQNCHCEAHDLLLKDPTNYLIIMEGRK